MTQKKLKAQKILNEEILNRMNIGKRYWNADLKDLPEGTLKDAFRKYYKNIHSNFDTGWGMYIFGDNGVGKTHSCCALLKEIQRLGYSTYCILADVLKVAYIDGSRFDKDSSVVKRVEKVDFLLIEDLGKEYSGKGSGFAELCFENLLRKRVRDCLPTIITTNLSPTAFEERYKKSAISLAKECMLAVYMQGEDRRKEISKEYQNLLGL